MNRKLQNTASIFFAIIFGLIFAAAILAGMFLHAVRFVIVL